MTVLTTLMSCPLNIESIAYLKNDPYSNTYNRETILTSDREDKVKAIKGDRVVKEIIAAMHLTIAKGIMTDHTT